MKGKYMLAAGGAVLVIVGCIFSPILASKLQNERLLNNVVIKEGVKEEENALSFPEKIALYAKGRTITYQNEKHNIPVSETWQEDDRISEEGIEQICTAAERELQTLKELGILPKECRIELPRGEKWYEIETFTDKQANWVTVYQIAVSGTDYGYLSLSIEKESGKIMELYAEMNMLEDAGGKASGSETSAGDDEDAVQDNSMEFSLEEMKEAWGKYIGMSPSEKEEKNLSGEMEEIELDGKGIICDYGKDLQVSYFLHRGEKTIEISTVCKDDTSMR